MEKHSVKNYINSKHFGCDHKFIAVNWKKTEKSKSATQLMCQHCLSVVAFQDVAESCGELKAEAKLHVADIALERNVIEPHVVDSEISESVDGV